VTITTQQYLTIVRTGLSVVGTVLATTGTVKGDDWTAISGAVLPIASILWGLAVHAPEATISRAEILKAQGLGK